MKKYPGQRWICWMECILGSFRHFRAVVLGAGSVVGAFGGRFWCNRNGIHAIIQLVMRCPWTPQMLYRWRRTSSSDWILRSRWPAPRSRFGHSPSSKRVTLLKKLQTWWNTIRQDDRWLGTRYDKIWYYILEIYNTSKWCYTFLLLQNIPESNYGRFGTRIALSCFWRKTHNKADKNMCFWLGQMSHKTLHWGLSHKLMIFAG